MNDFIRIIEKRFFWIFAISFFPFLSHAVTPPKDFAGFVDLIVGLLVSVLPVLVLLALFYFLWGLVQYLKNAGEKNEEAKTVMLHGIIGLFVMSSVWGFVGILSGTLGETPKKPDLGEAESYLDGSQIKDELSSRESDLKNSFKDNNKKLLEEPMQDLGPYDSLDDMIYDSSSERRSGGEVIEEEGEGSKEPNAPSWYRKILPWNWF